MAKANNYEVHPVEYHKADGTKSKREIIKFGDARDTIIAIQVNDLNADQRAELQSFLLAQKNLLAEKMTELGVDFKSFKPGMLTFLDGPQ